MAMPAHLRDVRLHYRDVGLETPLKYRAYVGTFYNQHRMAKTELDRLKKEGNPDQEQVKYHQAVMESAENSIAATLASWRITSYLYKEFNGGKEGDDKILLDAYNTISDYMNFNLFVKNYRDQTNMILKHLGFQILSFDQTALEVAKNSSLGRQPNSVKKSKALLKVKTKKSKTQLQKK